MPFYKVPSPNNSTSQADVKRVRAPLRNSQASSPDPPEESRASSSNSTSGSGSIQNFGGFANHDAHVNGRGRGEGDWVETTESNQAHWHPSAADMNGISPLHSSPPPDQQVSIVELEIQQQSEREAELIALRQSLYQQSGQSYVTVDHRVNRTSTGPERTPSSDARSRVATQRALSPLHPSSSFSPSPATVSVSAVTYEEAISTKAHPGESLIAREIMELKMREEELRRNRRGLERVPPTFTSDDVHAKPPLPLHLDSSIPSSLSKSVSDHAKQDAVDGDGRSRSRASRIRPLNDTEPDEVKFHPQMETPIDREVRLSREREDALRQARGLPTVSRADEEVVQMRFPDGTTGGGGGGGGGNSSSGGDRKSDHTMKKLASSRLMVEIEKEKQRELEVRRHNNQHPTSHHGNASASSGAGHPGNVKSNSYMRKY